MYTPRFNNVDDESQIREMVAAARIGWLVTVGDDAVPQATLLPLIWDEDTIITHMARANPHWRQIPPDAPALVIVTGPDAYITPSWYAAKTEHGKVVPTWNYTAVHLSGTARVHEDPAWLRTAVTDLTDRHEHHRSDPWNVSDAPDSYIEGQLRAIVGVEVAVDKVEGKAKLSQNRSEADHTGVIAGLLKEPFPRATEVAAAMQSAPSNPDTDHL
jgi:transcriptional regulator